MSVYTVAWLIWGAYFLIVEGVALFNRRSGDTLSEHVWRWFGTVRTKYGAGPAEQPNGWTRLRRVALSGFMLWLSIHFVSGGWM